MRDVQRSGERQRRASPMAIDHDGCRHRECGLRMRGRSRKPARAHRNLRNVAGRHYADIAKAIREARLYDSAVRVMICDEYMLEYHHRWQCIGIIASPASCSCVGMTCSGANAAAKASINSYASKIIIS